jgi:hypothetical protein
MRSIPLPQLNLFTTQSKASCPLSELQRARAVNLLKILLIEAVSAAAQANARPGQEVSDEQC